MPGIADIAARLTLNGSQFSSELARQFGAVEAAARDTAARTKSAFESSFNDIQQLSQRALSMPRNASGALDLNVGQARAAAQAAQAQAVALREVATAAEAAALKTGDMSENTRLYVQAARAAATEAEISAKASLQQANALDVLQSELNQTKSATEMVIQGNLMMNESMGVMGRGTNASRIAMVQASQQVQDFVIQVGAGQNPLRAFAMQASQMAFVLQGVGGAAGTMAGILSGPWGTAILTGITLLSMFGGKLFETEKAADAAKDATVDFANKQNEIGRFVDVLTGKIINQNQVLIQNAILKRQTAIDEANSQIHGLAGQIRSKITAAVATPTGNETFVAERQPGRQEFAFDPDLQRLANSHAGIKQLDAELGKIAARRPELQALRKEISDLAAQAVNLEEDRNIRGAEITALQGGGTEKLKELTGQAREAIKKAGGGSSRGSRARGSDGAAAAQKEADQRDRILATSQKQLDVSAEQFRFFGMQLQGLDRQAELERQIADINDRKVEALSKLPATEGIVSDALKEQLASTEAQASAIGGMMVQFGDRATYSAEEKKALADQLTLLESQLDGAKALAKTTAERAEIEKTIARIKSTLSGSQDEGAANEAAMKKSEQEWQQFQQRQAQEAQRQFDTLADFYYRAFSSGGKSIWKDFKDEGKRILAQIAALWTMAMLSGQKVSLGGILQQIGAQSGVGGMGGGFGGVSPLSLLFGGAKAIGATGAAASALGIGAPAVTALEGGAMSITDVTAGAGGAAAGGATGLLGSIGSAMPYAALAMGAGQLLNKIFGLKDPTGGLLGPVGALIAKAFGIGKPPKGGASISLGAGGLTSTYSGSGKLAGQIGGLSDQVISGIQSIADALGGTIGGPIGVSIGSYDGDIRVNTSGLTGGKALRAGSPGTHDFDKDADAAVRFAIQDAIQDGVITGISQASKNILKSGKDLQKAIEKAALIESIPKQLKAMLDPVGAAIDDLNEKWQKTVEALKEGGASAEQMAQAQQLYKLELDQVKESTKSASADLKDFLDSLAFGSNSPYSLRDQEAKSKDALQPFLDKINAGEPIDQSKYIDAAKQFLDIERQLYGSTAQFFDSMDLIQGATGKAISAIDNAVPVRTVSDPFNQATADNTKAIADILDQHTGILNEIAGSLTRDGGGGGSGAFIGGSPRGFGIGDRVARATV